MSFILNPYIHSRKEPNTFIGGVGATITNRAELAAKLTGIVESDIKQFSIDANNNVSCYIGKDFGIAVNAFHSSQSSHPTYFIHLGLHLKTVSGTAFYTSNTNAASRLRLFITPAELSIVPGSGNSVFRQDFNRFEVFACPNCIWLGPTTGYNNNFQNNRNNLWLYANPILATIDSGNPDGDIVYVEGGTNSVVKYSANFDAPQPISAVSFDEVGASFMKISWTDQAHSNSIDWQLMFLNGNYIGRVAAGVEEYLFTGLTLNTEYEVKILTIDQSGNSSLFSKAFKQTTASTPEIILTVDSFGGTYIGVGWTDSLPFAVDNYRIYVDGVLNNTVAGDEEAGYAIGLTLNTEYDVQVRAVLGGTEVSVSNTITQTTASTPDIALTVDSFGGTYIRVGWTDSLPFAVDNYRIYVNGVLNKTVSGDEVVGYVTGLTLNTEYDIQVRAVLGGTEVSTSNTITQTTASTPVFLDGLISYWDLRANANDKWGSNNGTATGVNFVSGGIAGNCADFGSGTSNNIEVADSDDLSFGNGTTDVPFTAICWVNWASLSGGQLFFNKLVGTAEYMIGRVNSISGLTFRIYDNTTSNYLAIDDPSTSLSTNTWYMVAGVYDGAGGLTMYLNATPIGSPASDGTYVAMENGTSPLVFGKTGSATTNSLDGKMCEISIWKKALSAGEMSDIYTKNLNGDGLLD